MYSISKIAQLIGAYKLRVLYPDLEIKELIYDSRKVMQGDTGLFFALNGAKDGHVYIAEAYGKGIRNFVVSQSDLDIVNYRNANFVWVEDTWRAIQSLAAYHRKRFSYPVIGITGSNGKTVVKEWLYEMLSEDKWVYQSPKSYNSQLGVALSLWNLNDDYDIAIIEAGISRPGEMVKLERMISPDIGIFTSIGVAHAEGFVTKRAKLEEKMHLFAYVKALIYPSRYIDDTVLLPDVDLFAWGQSDDDRIFVQEIRTKGHSSEVSILENGRPIVFLVPFIDMASIENCLTCISVMRYLGYDWDVIVERVAKLHAVEMRLQLKKGINNSSVIDDSYSNDLGSLRIALDFLSQQRQHSKKTLILSEMMDVSDDSKFTDKLVRLLSSYSLNRLIWVGKSLEGLSALPLELMAFSDFEELNNQWPTLSFGNETILVKGGRKFHFERVVKRLTSKSHGTVLEINLNAIEHNLKAYRSLLPREVKLMTMVKAFSYGSGSFEVANVLQYNKVDYLTVAFVDEGVELRQGGITLPIMVLSPDASSFDNLVAYHIEPEIYSFGILRDFIDYLETKGIRQYPIHVKLDTGMHRLGFLPSEVQELGRILRESENLLVKSIFSHLVASGDPSQSDFTRQQIAVFEEYATKIEGAIGYKVIKHLANTSAVVKWPQAYFDMVRLGIGLYGVDLDHSGLEIWPTSVLKTTVTQLKSLPAGETVGYDRKGVLYRDSVIATVKIGYADGYDRRFGNGVGKMGIGQYYASTIGNICMDMCMLDVTGLHVKEGDEVVVFPDLIKAARDIGVIPYELLVNISSRVKRIYYYE